MSPGARESRPGERAANDLADGRIGSQSTARPRPVSVIGEKLYHSLIGYGYQITGICRVCGAPLTDRKSVAAGVGPVCGKRVVSNG